MVAVATDQQYVRFITTGGVQTEIRSIGGPIVSLAANDEYLLIAYHQSGVFHGNQNISYLLLKDLKTVASGPLAISPNSTLSWISFSSEGYAVTYDSSGVLRGLFLTDCAWYPLFDSKLFEKKTKNDVYWPVGVSGSNFLCIICRVFKYNKGSQYPTFPRPVVNDIPLSMPLCHLDTECCRMEESLIRGDLVLKNTRNEIDLELNFTKQEASLDKIALQLFMVIR